MRKLLALGIVVCGLVVAARPAYSQVALPRGAWVATASTSNAGEPPSRAIDGSASTRWSTGVPQTQGQWFSIDMITPQTFSQLTVDPTGSTSDWASGYQVFVSNDAVDWGAPIASGTGTAGVLTIVFPTQTSRFVGIVQTGSASSWWSIGEINVFGPGATPTVALSPTGWVATASVTGGSDVPSHAIDGSLSTRWTTGTPQVNGQSFQLDMRQTQAVVGLKMNTDGSTADFARAFQIFVSDDPSNWGPAVGSGTGTSSAIAVTFPVALGRYLKVLQTGSASNWWSIAELTVLGVGSFVPAAQVLPRTGWVASASVSCSSAVPANALDDSSSTRFATCQNQANGQSFQVDMLTARSFTKLTLDAGTNSGDYPRGYAVYVSQDATNWGSPIATGTGSGQLLTITFPYQSARFVKVVETGSSSSNWWSITEFNVYGVPPYLLLRDGWVASASLSSSLAKSGIDGKLSTRWTTNTPQASGQWYQLDMLAPQSFDQLILSADGASSDFPRRYQVLTSNDGAVWSSPVATGTGSSSLVSIGFPSQQARFVRVVQTGTSSNWWSIAEVNVWSQSPGTCQGPGAPDGTPCDDGNKCTTGDTCHGGVCVGGPAMHCVAKDACHLAGACIPSTGVCADPNAPDGTACSDGTACTLGDSCHSGACNGTPKTCVAQDACHVAGTCDASTGACSQPAKPGPACSGIDIPANLTAQAPATAGDVSRELFGINGSTGVLSTAPLQNGASGLQIASVTIPAMAGTTSTCTADFDADGIPDLMFAGPTGVRWIPRVSPDVPLYNQHNIIDIDTAVPSGEAGPAACDDVNGDGYADVVISYNDRDPDGADISRTFLYLAQPGGGTFQRSELSLGFPTGVAAAGKALADFDGDGNLDLVVFAANTSAVLPSQIYVFPNSGPGPAPFSSANRVPVQTTSVLMTTSRPNWGSLTVVDVDGDGHPDISAVGNRGGWFTYQSIGGFQFADPELGGVVPNPPATFDIFHLNPDINGLLALAIGGRRAPDLTIHTTAPNGILIGAPSTTASGWGAANRVLPHYGFIPPFPPAGASQEVGLARGAPVVTTYVDADGVTRLDEFVLGVNGHLLERREFKKHIGVFRSPIAQTFNFSGLPLNHLSRCTAQFCENVNGSIAISSVRQEASIVVSQWIDHGPPPGTIVDSKPTLAVTQRGFEWIRAAFVRGLDGHLWALEQHSDEEFWADYGVPPSAKGIDWGDLPVGTTVPVMGSPSATVPPGSQAPDVFVIDAAGRLDRLRVDGAEGEGTWSTLGFIGAGGCFARVGELGDGSPKALSWTGGNGTPHEAVFVADSAGALQNWQDGVWRESLGQYQARSYQPNAGPIAACNNGNQVGYADGFTLSPPVTGTPDAIVWYQNGVVHQSVYARSSGGDLVQYQSLGENQPVREANTQTLYVSDANGLFIPRCDLTVGCDVRMSIVKSPHVHPASNGATVTTTLASDPVIVPDGADRVHLVGQTSNGNLAILDRITGQSQFSDTWKWLEFDFPSANEPFMVRAPGAAITPAGLTAFALRSNGIMAFGLEQQADPSTLTGTFTVTEAPPSNVQALQASSHASAVGCKSGEQLGEQIFPQWRNVLGQRAHAADTSLYPNPSAPDEGYETEVLSEVQGTVVDSHISSEDNPTDHTVGPSSEIPRIHHDWNILVALDVPYQGMLSDANMIETGLMEIEWEQSDDKWSLDAVPSPGDRVAVRGRFIFDCGHPPPRTEIHPPDAIAVIHGATGKVRFSNQGGFTWFQPSDTDLAKQWSGTVNGVLGDECSLPDAVTEGASTLGVKAALWGAGICVRTIDLTPAAPQNLCSFQYTRSMTDKFDSNAADALPLTFSMAQPDAVGTSFGSSALSFSGGFKGNGAPAAPLGLGTDGLPAWNVTVGGPIIPDGPVTIPFSATGLPASIKPTHKFDVKLAADVKKRHDNTTSSYWTQVAVDVASWFYPSFSDVNCEDDTEDEIVMFATVNGVTQKMDYATRSITFHNVTVNDNDTLSIRAGGFECDFSCGERWDDDFLQAPNDRIGYTRLAFTANERFGSKGIGVPASYLVKSQPDLTTARSRVLSEGDYWLNVTITEMPLP